MKKGSSVASSPSSTLDNAVGTGRFVCSMCSKVYRSGAGLRYHKRKRHRGEGMVEPTALHRVKCQEPGCTYQMLAISDLRNHLANHHHKPEYKCTEEKRFTSIADFSEWKSSFESLTGSKYVKNCGAKGKSDNQTTEYYYCNRTGPFGQGLRRNKAQGSLRCGIHCTSSMKVEIQTDEHVTVQYYPAHYGHSNLPATDEPNLSENSMTMNGMNGNSSTPAMFNVHHSQQQQQQDQNQTSMNHYPSHGGGAGDCSSSSSPGSASTSPSGGSNSNSNQQPLHPTKGSLPDRSTLNISNTPLKNNMYSSSSNNNNNQHHHHQQQQQQHQQQQHQQQQHQQQQHQQHQQQHQQHQQQSLQNHLSHCIIISPSFMVEESASSHSNHHSTPVFVAQQAHQHSQPQHLTQPSAFNSSTLPSAVLPPTTNIVVKKEKCVSDIMREAFQLLSYWPLDHHHGLVTAENEQAIQHSHVNMDEHLMF